MSFAPLPCRLLLPLLIVALPSAAWAGSDKMTALLKDYSSISRDLYKAQQTQAVLLKQKTDLDDKGLNLSSRQLALNTQADTHNSVAEQQKRELAAAKSNCSNSDYVDGKNTPQHINDCDNKVKKLNKVTLQVNAGVKPIQDQQSELDLEFAQYTQAANDWSVQEDRNTTSLNALYRALNDWADRADDYMGGAPFLDQVEAAHADQVCSHRNLPDGLLSIEELQHYAAGADRCLKYVATQQKLASTHGG